MMKLHNRLVLVALPALAIFTPGAAISQDDTRAMPRERPNIVFIITDDLSDAVEPLDSVPTSATPAMTRLSSMGVTFTNAHANSPVCAPSRNSMFSGYHPRTTGAYDFRQWKDSEFLSGTVSMFKHFQNAGYVTLGTGKLHHHTGAHRDDWSMIDGKRQYESNFDAGPWPWNGDPDNSRTIHPEMAFLLDHVKGLKNERRMRGSSSRSLSFGRLSDVPSYPANSKKGLPGYTGWRYMDGKPFRYISADDRDLMPDEQKTQFAVQALRRDYDSPFLLAVGFNRPHEPLYLPDEYYERFPLDKIELPPMLESDWDDLDMIPESSRGYAFDRYTMYMRAGGETMVKRYIQAYLASTAFIDDQVGQILDELAASPYADNTIVVFTSDHGYHLGEKGAIYKATLWDEATRVPMIIAAPGLSEAGGRSNRPVSLLDLYPTLLDLTGVAPPTSNPGGRPLDGKSLSPLLANTQARIVGQDYVLNTIYGSEKGDSEDWRDQNFSMRGERWRYTRYNNGGEELYDTVADPQEWHNLAQDPKYAPMLEAWRARFEADVAR